MIKVFTAITTAGVGDPGQLAGGISEALITTAAGLTIAIPCLIFHRHLKRKIDDLVMGMEAEAMKLVAFLHGDVLNGHILYESTKKPKLAKSKA
jgi:biopolymer transport protein ExbB